MTNQLSTQGDTQPTTLAGLLKSPAIAKRLNDSLGAKTQQFASSVLSLVQNDKLLRKCNPMTVLTAAMQAAQLDLPVSAGLQFAYVIPYKDQAQFQLGYKGLIQLALRSGQFSALNDGVIGKGQLRSYDPLTEKLVVDFNVEPEGETPAGYFCYFRLVNGFEKIVFWPHEKVIAHAERFSQAYRAGRNTPWKTDFESMARKTVIKAALSKYAPLSVEMQRAMTIDQATVDLDGNVVEYPDNKMGGDESAFDLAAGKQEPEQEESQEGEVTDIDTDLPDETLFSEDEKATGKKKGKK